VLLTRPPLDWRELPLSASFDLHVLGTPPAFILSQDQTLHLKVFLAAGRSRRVEFESVLLFPKQEVLSFAKDRKKTSGTLYSVFKEPDPRALPPDDAVPPAFR
jgi:hypothetical protein